MGHPIAAATVPISMSDDRNWPPLPAALTILSCAIFAREAIAVRKETAFLRATLVEVVGKERIASADDLRAIKRHLSRSIRCHSALENARRPLLRSSAQSTLRTGWGFCGENARVAILLLHAGGVRANRLYLEGERWQHVAVEHAWDGGYRLFDAHNDPATLLPDELVGEIDSNEIGRFPNATQGNSYQRVYRLRALERRGLLGESPRLPAPVAVTLERPAVIKAALALVAATISAVATALLRRRR